MVTRVSDKFGLGVTQGALDFVDVNVAGDTPVYIEPRAIRTQTGDWADSCVGLLQTFFEALLAAVKAGDSGAVTRLLSHTSEPNETHLGQSRGVARGRGLGDGKKGEDMMKALTASRAAGSGLLKDLEDAALLVPTMGRDTISDITTNIIRGPLIQYTQEQCVLHSIPMEIQDSGMVWSDIRKEWESGFVDLPRASGDKLLLVPKSIVRFNPMYDMGNYYRGYLRPIYEAEELGNPASGLVQVLKGGRRKVLLGKLDKHLGTSKPDIARMTERDPGALARYRKSVTAKSAPPPTEEEYVERTGVAPVDFMELYDSIMAISPGRAGADSYHRAVANLLTAVFDGALGNQDIEYPVHDGRKRIDIKYDNLAPIGFFHWAAQHYKAPIVPIECKNYSEDPTNPEIDQIAMRLSHSRGNLGIMVCRELKNRPLMTKRRQDVQKDGHGYVLVLDDTDLRKLAEDAAATRGAPAARRLKFELLRKQFDELL